MQRHAVSVRPDWRARVESLGFFFHTMDGPYWDESACYVFTAQQVDDIEAATQELHIMCLEAVEHVCKTDLFHRLKIPLPFADLVARSWKDREPSVYGRFDLVYDGRSPAKLLEYNADTPTALFEASVVQWQWLQDVDSSKDQFNSLHEKLIDRWKDIGKNLPVADVVYFGCSKESLEDLSTVEYLRDTATQAGLNTQFIYVEDIGAAEGLGGFVDIDGQPINTIFKLYPWEWMIVEDFGKRLLPRPWRVLEPAWKMILSNKAILPILWELFPKHPNLLPSYFDRQSLTGNYVQKPIYSREGANVTLVGNGAPVTSPGPYGADGYIYQAYAPLPGFQGRYPVVGSWIVGEQAAGIGIREDASPITRNTSRFIPHYFV